MTKKSLQEEIRQTRPFGSKAEEAGLSLLRTTDRFSRRIGAVVEPHGITLQQYNVLRILRGSHPDRLPTLEIATRKVEQAPGITRLLDRLEAKNLVRRERCEKDRRRVYCAITPAGLGVLARLDAPVAAAARASFRTLSAEQTHQLIDLLDALREGLTDDESSLQGEGR